MVDRAEGRCSIRWRNPLSTFSLDRRTPTIAFHQKTKDIFLSLLGKEYTYTHIGFRRTSRTTNDNSGIATALGRRVLIIRCTPFLLKAVVFARVYPAKRFSFSFIIIKSKSHRRTKRTRSGSSALPSSRSFFDRRGLNERFTSIVLYTRDDDFRCPGWIWRALGVFVTFSFFFFHHPAPRSRTHITSETRD